MKRLVLFTLLLCLLPLSLALGAGQEYRIKFATVAPEGSAWLKAMNELDAELRERTDGRLGFLIYAGGIAGDELDVLKKIRIGQLHCAAFSGVGLGAVLPSVRVLDLPMLFRDAEDVDRVRTGLTSRFAEDFSREGFRFISWAEIGPVHLFSKTPIRTIADLKKAKVWAWSGDPVANETFDAMGLHPIRLSITDVSTALNTGMIDTVYAPPMGALALQWQTSLRYMSALPLAYANAAVLLSNSFFQQLPPELANVLGETFSPAMERLTGQIRRQVEQTTRTLQNAGVEMVAAPTGEELLRFEAIHSRVAQRLEGELYPAGLLDEVYRLLGRRPSAQE
ncbi:Extracellular solute-binding protein, family 7 [uncultured Desulfatiglans sp.]|uniref:Extracellular solute-binding protein, family 7 n=1 Tax=Uncultured Desulfatiglans sp. TaxID=1748965 RepID=A0A653A9B3_UNCDX|nr:Extracellular solute-binding protein, family 7 [uncultured Desulfatiglans sp.]